MPRNVNKDSIIARPGPADYQKLSSAGFATPTDPLDVGAISLDTDTGDKWEWTGSVWVPTHRAGKQEVIARDYYNAVREGLIPGHTLEDKFGSAVNIGTSFVPVSTSQTYQTYTTAQALEIVSNDNTNDIPAGSGARSVTIIGLDGSWDLQSETVALNGTTAVNLVNSYTRIFRLYVASSGTYATTATPSHNSIITVRDQATSTVIWGQIIQDPGATMGLGQSEIGCVSIPDGYIARLMSRSINIESTKSAHVIFFVREGADNTSAPYSPMLAKYVRRGMANNIESQFKAEILQITGPADFGFMARAVTGTTSIEVDFQYILEAA